MSDIEQQKTVNCVLKPFAGLHDRLTWCGRPGAGHKNIWAELDIAFLVSQAERPGSLLCQDCEAAIRSALRTAATGEKPVDEGRLEALESRYRWWIVATNVLSGWVQPLGAERPKPLTLEEQAELEELRRRAEARVPCEVRQAIGKVRLSHTMTVHDAVRLLENVFGTLTHVRRTLERDLSPKEPLTAGAASEAELREVLGKVSERLMELHGEHYDCLLGVSERGVKMLAEALAEQRAERDRAR